MSSIGNVGGAGSDTWAALQSQRNQRLFARADSDASGGIDKTELGAVLENLQSRTGQAVDVESAFSGMDGNQDGSLDSEELAQGLRALAPPPTTMEFAQGRGDPGDGLFSKLDTDGNGSLDASEQKAFADRVSADRSEDITDRLASLDSDGDGALSQAEFEAGRPAGPGQAQAADAGAGAGAAGKAGAAAAGGSADSTEYDPLDTNRDGVVSEIERLAGELRNMVQEAASGNGSTTSAQFADLARRFYEQIAAGAASQGASTGQTLDVSA